MATYFRIVLVTPLILGLLGLVIRGAGIGRFFETMTALLFVGGLPYIIFVAVGLFWSFRQDNADYKKAFLLGPLAFGLFFFVISYIRAISMKGGEGLLIGIPVSMLLTSFAIVVSGIFSWAALGLWHLVKRIRRSKV